MPSQFLLEQNSIPVPRQLAATIGLEEATVFQQLWYSLQNPQMGGTVRNGQKWIRNPIECRDSEKQQRAAEHGKAIDWLSNFPFLSVYKLRRIFAKLENLGLVISRKLRASRWDHCKYYTIDNSKLTELLKALKLSICQFSTNRSVENLQMDVTTASKSYQIYNSTIPLQNLEREPGAENKSWEEEKEAPTDLTLRFDKEQELETRAKVSRSDKSSAAVALGFEPIAPNDLREFQSQLEDLGKRLGRKSPVAWAYTIVKNLNTDKPCTYWEEFKAGIPLGTSDQREWEIEPGVACSIAIQCLEQDYLSRPGTTPQEAARKAAQTIARPKEMAAVWESIKSQVMFRRSEWEKQSTLGVQSPVIDSWMVPRQPASVEEVAIALQEIQLALPVALLPNQELLPIIPIVEAESAIGDENAETTLAKALPNVAVTDYGSKAAPDNEGIATAAKAKISAVLSKFARPSKKQAILEANIAEAKDVGYTALVAKVEPVAKVSSSGGLADYLRQIEADVNNSW